MEEFSDCGKIDTTSESTNQMNAFLETRRIWKSKLRHRTRRMNKRIAQDEAARFAAFDVAQAKFEAELEQSSASKVSTDWNLGSNFSDTTRCGMCQNVSTSILSPSMILILLERSELIENAKVLHFIEDHYSELEDLVWNCKDGEEQGISLCKRCNLLFLRTKMDLRRHLSRTQGINVASEEILLCHMTQRCKHAKAGHTHTWHEGVKYKKGKHLKSLKFPSASKVLRNSIDPSGEVLQISNILQNLDLSVLDRVIPEPDLTIEDTTERFCDYWERLNGNDGSVEWRFMARDPAKYKEELYEKFSQGPTKQQNGLNSVTRTIVDTLMDRFKEQRLAINIHVAMSIVNCLINVVAHLKCDYWAQGLLHNIAILSNIFTLVATLWGAFKFTMEDNIHNIVENLSCVIFNLIPENVDTNVPNFSVAEVATALGNTSQQGPEHDVSKDLLETYGILKKNLVTPKADAVMVAVNGISWILSLAAVFSIRSFGWDIRSAVSHLTFMKYARELQQNLARDVNEIQKWLRELWLKPKEVNYNLLANRIARCEQMLSTSDIDIVCEPSLLYEWDFLIGANKQLLATPQQDDGLRNLRTLLGQVHIRMLERANSVKELTKARGLRPVPVALHLWSDIGGIGKSSYVTNSVVPEVHKIVGSSPGSETWLKLGVENKYFPPLGERSKICVVDEFIGCSELDPTLAHINGMISETPYYLDAAFFKNQAFSAEFIALLSNIPGCNLSGDQLRMNTQAAVALWGRLLQFEVVNVSRPADQSPYERDFEHEQGYSDLRFLPGKYVPEKAPNNSGVSPVYSTEVELRRSKTNLCWMPERIEINGELFWEINHTQLMQFIEGKIRKSQVMFSNRLRSRKEEMQFEAGFLSSAKFSLLTEYVEPKMVKLTNLAMIEQQRRHSNWISFAFAEAKMIEGEGQNLTEIEIANRNYARYLHGQYSQAIMSVLAEQNWDSLGVPLHTVGEVLCLAVIVKRNVYIEGKIKLEIPGCVHDLHLNIKEKSWYDGNPPPVLSPVNSEVVQVLDDRMRALLMQKQELEKSIDLLNSQVNTQRAVSLASSTDSSDSEVQMALQLIRQLRSRISPSSSVANLLEDSFSSSSVSSEEIARQEMGDEVQDELLRLRQENARLQTQLATKPTLVRPLQTHHAKFAVLLYGIADSGKSYYAKQVAESFRVLTGMPIVMAGSTWWNEVTPNLVNTLQQRPHIIVSDDSCWTQHYIDVYDNSHLKTIFINTVNERIESVPWYKKFTTCRDKFGYLQTITNSISRFMMEVKTLDSQGQQLTSKFPEGLIRRVGINGLVWHKGSQLDVARNCNMMIEMQGCRPVVKDRLHDPKYYSPSECFDIIFQRYNEWLHICGELEFVNCEGYDSVATLLGDQFKSPDVHINAGTLIELQSMLKDYRSIFSHYTNSTPNGNFIFVSPKFIKDPMLSITNPEAFLFSVNGTPTVEDIIEQGVKMYKKVQRGAANPAIRITVGTYDVYCFRNKIYVNHENYQTEINFSKNVNSVKLSCGEGVCELAYSTIWEIVKPNSDFLPTEEPTWAVYWVRSNREMISDWDEVKCHKISWLQQEKLREYLIQHSQSWSEIFAKVQDSPYWKILSIAACVATLVSMLVTVSGIFKKKEVQEVKLVDTDWKELENLSKYYNENFDYDSACDSDDAEEIVESFVSDTKSKITPQQQQKLVPFAKAIAQSGPGRKKGSKGNKGWRKKQRTKGDYRRSGAQVASSQMVRTLKPVFEQNENKNIVDVIAKKVEDSLVIVEKVVDGHVASAYGIVLFDRTVLCPAHYFPREWGNTEFDKIDNFRVKYIERGSGKEVLAPARVTQIKRNLEIMTLEIPSSFKRWQSFPNIRPYFMTTQDAIETSSGFLLVHEGDYFSRYHCTLQAVCEAPTNLTADDVRLNQWTRVCWLSATCKTGPGYCGQPYIGNTKNERCIMGFHVAANNNWAYAALLTSEILNEFFDDWDIEEPPLEQTPDMYQLTTFDVKKFLEEKPERAEECPDMPQLLELEKTIGYPLAVPSFWIDTYNEIDFRYKSPYQIRDSPNHTILGYIREFDGAKDIKLKKKFSIFKELLEDLGYSNPKSPSITNLGSAPSSHKVEVQRLDGTPAGESIYWAQMVKSCTGFSPSTYDQEKVNHAISILGPRWSNLYSRHKYRLLNDYEILNGIGYGPLKGMTEGMDLSSAVGLPMSGIHKSSLKSAYVEFVEVKGQIIKAWKHTAKTQELLIHISDLLTLLERGIYPICPFKASIKAELIDKKLGPKSRLFCATGIDLIYITIMFFGTYAAAIKKYHPEAECQVGVDPVYGLGNLWNRMIRKLDNGSNICLDYSRWDKTLQFFVMKAVADEIVRDMVQNFQMPNFGLFTDVNKLKRAMTIVLMQNISPFISVEGVLLHTQIGLPSGTYITAWFNSHCNSLIMCAAILIFQDEQNFQMIVDSQSFIDNCVAGNYGDDTVIRLASEFITRGLTYSTFARLVEQHFGMMCTPASKVGSTQETVQMDEIDFISRSPKYLHGGLWLNRLKKVSIDVLWWWVTTKGKEEEMMIQNVESIFLESILWGKKEYNRQLDIANRTKKVAAYHGWYDYVQHINMIPSYESAMDILEHNLSINALCSSPAVFNASAILSDLTNLPREKLLDNLKTIYDKPRAKEREQIPDIDSNQTNTSPGLKPFKESRTVKQTSKRIAIQSQTRRAQNMLPDKYSNSPFGEDRFKTILWLQGLFTIRAIRKVKNEVVIWSSQEDYKRVCKEAEEVSFDGFTLVKLEEEGSKPTWFCYSLTTQLTNSVRDQKKILHVMGDIVNHIQKSEFKQPENLNWRCDMDDLGQPKRIVWFLTENASAQIGLLKPQNSLAEEVQLLENEIGQLDTEITDFLTNLEKEDKRWRQELDNLRALVDKPISPIGRQKFPKPTTSIANQQSTEPKPVGSTAPTADARAAPAAPSAIEAQISNQQNNGALGFGNIPAENRMAEGGMLIQVTEAMCNNWMQVYNNGGPVISVPVSTAAGTVLWKGNITDCENELIKWYRNAHRRWYPNMELMLNFIGTATWAGNVAVFVTPIEVPSTSASVLDNNLRIWGYEQKPLSTNGAQVIELNRLINPSQTNVAWDDADAASTGPWVYIQLVTAFEQALANESAAFQIQLLSRLGPRASFGGVNVENILKMNQALATPSASKWDNKIGATLSRCVGLSLEDFFRVVLGFNMVVTPSLITNGTQYLPEDRLGEFSGTKTFAKGYNFYGGTDGTETGNTYSITQHFDVINFNSGIYKLTDYYTRAMVSGVGTTASNTDSGFHFMSTGNGFSKEICQQWSDFESAVGNYACVGIINAYQLGGNAQKYRPTAAADFIQHLLAQEYAVTYIVLEQDVQFWNGTAMQTTGKYTQARVEKDGIVDVIAIGAISLARIDNFSSGRITLIPPSDTEPEISYSSSRGYQLPSGIRRVEISTHVRPVMNGIVVPVASNIETNALLRFLNDQCPSEYYTRMSVWSDVTGRKAFDVFYTQGFGSLLINFGNEDSPKWSVYAGEPMGSLKIRSIELVDKAASISVSDSSFWRSYVVNSQNLSEVQALISSVARRNNKPVLRKLLLTKELQELVKSEVDSATEQRRLKKARQKELREQLAACRVEPASSQFAYQQFHKRSDRIQLGSANNFDMRLASMALGMVGGPAGATAAGAVQGAKGATTAGAQTGLRNARNAKTQFVRTNEGNNPSRVDAAIPPGYSSANWRERDASMREMLNARKPGDTIFRSGQERQHFGSNRINVQRFDEQTYGYRGQTSHPVSTNQVASNNQSVSTVTQVNPRVSDQSATTLKIPSGLQHPYVRGVNQDLSYNTSRSQRTEVTKAMAKSAEERRQARFGACSLSGGTSQATQCMGAGNSAIEGMINKEISAQEHGFTMEEMNQYFKNMTAQQKEQLANDLQAMKEKYGYDTNLQQNQQKHESELQANEFEQTNTNREDTQQHEQDMSQLTANLEAQKEQRQLRYGGLLTSGLAGVGHAGQGSFTSGIRSE